MSEIKAAKVKSVLAELIAAEMKRQHISMSRMAELMQTSRVQVDWLLDPANGIATLETLIHATHVVERELCFELV